MSNRKPIIDEDKGSERREGVVRGAAETVFEADEQCSDTLYSEAGVSVEIDEERLSWLAVEPPAFLGRSRGSHFKLVGHSTNRSGAETQNSPPRVPDRRR